MIADTDSVCVCVCACPDPNDRHYLDVKGISHLQWNYFMPHDILILVISSPTQTHSGAAGLLRYQPLFQPQ